MCMRKAPFLRCTMNSSSYLLSASCDTNERNQSFKDQIMAVGTMHSEVGIELADFIVIYEIVHMNSYF